jgi:hypothetical protein
VKKIMLLSALLSLLMVSFAYADTPPEQARLFDQPLEVAAGLVVGFFLKDAYSRIKGTEKSQGKFVTDEQCRGYRSTCAAQKLHDADDTKADVQKLFDKTNCIDTKVARIIGALEAKGWLEKQR